MTDTSKSGASRFFVEGKNLHTDPKTGSAEYVETINHLLYALLDSGTAQHKAVRLTFARVPKDTEIERGDIPVFLQLLLESNSASKVCALDMSLPRNAEGWFRRRDQDKGPRVFKHIRKLYIRFPEEPEDNKVSLQDVNRILKESLTPDNRFPSLEEFHISGLNEKAARNAQDDPLIGPKLFVLLIDGPNMLQLVEETGRSIGYRVSTTTHREGEQDASNGIDSPRRSGSDWLTFTKSK